MTAIKVENLSKMFKLYSSQGSRFIDYLSLGELKRYQEFWALRDISFTVPKGSTFGILGQNGSGKSTLLSILAGVLEPSLGSFVVNGRVSAILELGSGFHPEFTGRANVYMYGSIIGLHKEIIDERLPEIIHFSELGDFIDQPLRTYSSGMYARLAFSVAVNSDADVLIVDEALAVGDALFQHRCFRKIHELKESGKTILYVGHDTEAVRGLCDHAMILDSGKMLSIGDSTKVSNEYLALIAEREQKYYESNLQEYGNIPNQTYEPVYNFIENLIDAEKKVISSEDIREVPVEIRSVPRRTIFAHPPSELKYKIHIEEGYILAFAIGIYPKVYDFIQEGINFLVFINEEKVFSRLLNPKKSAFDRGWHNQIVDFSGYYGKDVTIKFVTQSSGQDIQYCCGGWGWMQLMRPFPRLNTQINEVPHIRTGTKRVEIIDMKICNENEESISSIKYGEYFFILMVIRANCDINERITVGTTIRNKYGTISGTNTLWGKCDIMKLKKNEIKKIIFKYHGILNSGMYMISPAVALANDQSYEIERLDRYEDNIILNVYSSVKFEGFVNLAAGIEIINITDNY